jgi:hypothetical protein
MRLLDRTTSARRRRTVGASLLLALLTGLVAPAHAVELPPGPTTSVPAPSPLDAPSTYVGQTTCSETVKPGAQAVLRLAMDHWKIGRSSGITRGCAVGGQSEHKEGRAFDWGLNVANPREKAAGDQFTEWLVAVGPDGKPGYNARRLGVMYVIWNKRIWAAYNNAGWKPYTGPVPHTDHVHVSLSWAGAAMRTSWWTGTAVPFESVTRRYVGRVYQDLFHRDVDPSGAQSWTKALVDGLPRVEVANSITSSAEYRSGLITGAYRDFLGRAPDTAGLRSWLAAMNGGMQIQQMEGGFLASPEYYAQSGSNDAAWVRRLYQHVLLRDAAESEVQQWVQAQAQGVSRERVARGFLISTERLSRIVDGYYLDLLGRPLDPVGQQGWVGAIQAGTRTEVIIGGIIASAEYYAKV